MIDHIVLFRWAPGAEPAARSAAVAALAELPARIPGIVRYTAGVQNSPEGLARGLDWGFVMTFADAAARDAYLPHPAHRQVVETLLKPILAEVLVFDFEHGTTQRVEYA